MDLCFLLFVLLILSVFFFYTKFALLWLLSIVGIILIFLIFIVKFFYKLYLELRDMPPKEPSKKIITATNETKKVLIETMKLERVATNDETKIVSGIEKMIKGLKDWFS